MVRRLFSLESSGISQYIAQLIEDAGMVARLAAVFATVSSPTDAIGSIRFLQMLVLADGEDVRPRNAKEAAEREDRRWARMEALVSLLPPFFEQYGEFSAGAIDRGDVSLLAAVSSLRWALIIAMGRLSDHSDRNAGRFSQSRLQWLFALLQSIEALRMPAISVDDHDDMDALFASPSDARIELAYRNAFTLLDGASRCGWRDGWKDADSGYLPKNTPSMWEWPRALRAAPPTPKPAATQPLRDLFNQELVKASLEVGPGLAVHDGRSLDTLAMSALHDLASFADIRAPLPSGPPVPLSPPASTSLMGALLPPATPSASGYEPAPEHTYELTPAPELSLTSEPVPEAGSDSGSPTGPTESEAYYRNSHDVSSQLSHSSSAKDESGPLLNASREKEWEGQDRAHMRAHASG
ncbi:unnamed protein product [Peniophora sp. CBMAI 1063]|nr:unnamed protein product [Peniophora sp. CBMAI 1063]